MSSKNPLSFLGLRRAGEESEEVEVKVETNNASPKMSKGGLQLNKRGIPARKRKLNSLIYGTDDLVSIPIKSPKKRGPKTPSKVNNDFYVKLVGVKSDKEYLLENPKILVKITRDKKLF